MMNRAKATLSLAPAIILLFVWIAVAPRLIEVVGTFYLLSIAVISAIVAAWSISMFANGLVKKE